MLDSVGRQPLGATTLEFPEIFDGRQALPVNALFTEQDRVAHPQFAREMPLRVANRDWLLALASTRNDGNLTVGTMKGASAADRASNLEWSIDTLRKLSDKRGNNLEPNRMDQTPLIKIDVPRPVTDSHLDGRFDRVDSLH